MFVTEAEQADRRMLHDQMREVNKHFNVKSNLLLQSTMRA